MDHRLLTLAEVNALDQPTFAATLGGLFEGSPWIAAAGWAARPFSSRAALHAAHCAVMYAAPRPQQVALIQAHPDLVGQAARAGTLTPDSTQEQAAAGLDRLTPAEAATFTRLNAQYWAQYGFPFVICARANKKAGILAGFETRLRQSREAEIATALAEIAQIAQFRLHDIVGLE